MFYKEESQYYKIMSLSITRKQSKETRRSPSQRSVTVCDRKSDYEKLLSKRIDEEFNQCPNQGVISSKKNQD